MVFYLALQMAEQFLFSYKKCMHVTLLNLKHYFFVNFDCLFAELEEQEAVSLERKLRLYQDMHQDQIASPSHASRDNLHGMSNSSVLFLLIDRGDSFPIIAYLQDFIFIFKLSFMQLFAYIIFAISAVQAVVTL